MVTLHHSRLQLARIYLAVLSETVRKTGNLRRLREHRSRLMGDLPAPGVPGIVLCACDEIYYARFASDLVLSAEATGERHHLHLHLYAPSPQTLDHVGQLRRSLIHTALTCTWEDGAFERYGVDAPIYFTSGRYLVMHHLLTESRAPVLCVDIDGLIRRPLGQAFEQIGAADLTIHFRLHRKEPWRRVLAAAIGVNPTPKGMQFCERMASSIEAVLHQRPVYHIDQTILYYAYSIRKRLGQGVRWQNLPLTWVDYEFSDDSLIWTAKAARKQDARFRNAIASLEARYEALYRALPDLPAAGAR